MLKQKISGSVQEVIFPDFPDDDDTVTTTVTKSRRVSFGPNFVKEFIVDSAVSAQCMSEYEQPFPSSDSSNADSSHSAVGQSTFVVHENVKIHKAVPAEAESTDGRPKPPKFASTICFSADSPTADMEFTEGCITLAKSILDKKNKEMTVFIQAKPKGQKEEEKPKEDETNYFEGSQFEMSMTRCMKSKEKKREEKKFVSEKTKIFGNFDDEMSMTRCEKFFKNDESDNSWEDSKENRMPLDAIMRHLDKDSSDSDLFNPERPFGKLLGANPFDLSDDSENLNLSESVDMMDGSTAFPPSLSEAPESPDKIVVDKMEEIKSGTISVSLTNLSKDPETPIAFDENAVDVNFGEKSNLSGEAMEISFDIQQETEKINEEVPAGDLDSNEVGEMTTGLLGNSEDLQQSKSLANSGSSEASEVASAVAEYPPPCENGGSPLKWCVAMDVDAELRPSECTTSEPVEDAVDDVGVEEAEKSCPNEVAVVVGIEEGGEERAHSEPPADGVTGEELDSRANESMEITTDLYFPQNVRIVSEDDNVGSTGITPDQEEDGTREPSLGDLKVIESLKEQSKEPGCLWYIKDLRHPQKKTEGLLSFSCRLLESTTSVEFILEASTEDGFDSCSVVTGSSILLDEEKQCRVPEYTLAVGFGFEELKKRFEERRQRVETIRHVPYFLDHVNSFLSKTNAYLRQIHSILTLYPGSRLTNCRLSFRLFSFPVFFSCVVSVDLSNMFRLSKSSLSFEHDFGSLDEKKVGEIFEECLKGENSLCEFVVQSTGYLVELERQSGYLSKRRHIRLLPDELRS